MNSDNIWLDPLYLDDLLSEEEKSIRKTTKDYCNKNLLPIVVKDNRENHFDKNIYNEKLKISFITKLRDQIKFKNENNLNVEKILSMYKNDKNLKILKDGIIQYSKEFDSLENRCHFIKDLAAKIN